jgi:hypothetical protein
MKPMDPTRQGLPTPDPVKTGAAATERLMLAKASGVFFLYPYFKLPPLAAGVLGYAYGNSLF